MHEWSTELEVLLKSPNKEKIKELRQSTDSLERFFERVGVEGPNSAGFHRDLPTCFIEQQQEPLWRMNVS